MKRAMPDTLIENLRDIAQTLDRMGGDASPDVIREAINEIRRLRGAAHWESAYERAAARVVELTREVESLRAFKRSVDEALNSGDGSYRP